MEVDIDAISDYAWRMERTGSSPCYIETKHIRAMIAELKAARKVVEAARNLRAEVLGLNIASYEIMQAIGQTNWSVLKERNVELRKSLEELDGDVPIRGTVGEKCK